MSGRPSQAPAPGELRPYNVPAAERWTLANGLTVLASRHGITPLVTVRVVVDAGVIREPASRAGLAALMVKSLDTAAGGRTGEQLAWEFERLGVELESQTGYDASFLEVTVAAERLDPALALLADVLRRPDFPAAEIDRLRGEHLAEIQQRSKDPRALANDMIVQFLFGPDHPYGRPTLGLAARVADLQAQHATAFHSACTVPSRTSFVIVGAIEPEAALAAIDAHFGDWSAAGEAVSPMESSPDSPATAIHIVDRPGSVQSEIRAAHVGVDRRHPDYHALRIMNSILGGAFTSRLNLSLRERHGFTYGVRTGYAFRRAPGPFQIQTAVATEVTARAIEETIREVRGMHDAGATVAEVDDARDYLAGVVPLEFQTTDQIARQFADLALYDLPDDYFRNHRARFEAVTVEETARVASVHLQPDNLTICVVGDASAIRDPLAALGLGEVQVHS